MDRYDGPATIQQGDRSVQVRCVFDTVPPTLESQGSWGGTYTHAEPFDTLDKAKARLLLPSGEEADIIIRSVYVGTGTHGTFKGRLGPPS